MTPINIIELKKTMCNGVAGEQKNPHSVGKS
jgi:hypothetical protein